VNEVITVPHVFYDGGFKTWDRGLRICQCGQIETSRAHDVPETPADVRAAEARRIGEVDS
jgi:hypothetical protein